MSTIFRDSKRWHLKNYESDELFLYSRHACSASSMVSIVSGVDIAINSCDDPGVLNVIQLINEHKANALSTSISYTAVHHNNSSSERHWCSEFAFPHIFLIWQVSSFVRD